MTPTLRFAARRALQTSVADPGAADRAERDGRRHQDAAAPRAPERPHRQGGARLHLHHALQRQRQRPGLNTHAFTAARSSNDA